MSIVVLLATAALAAGPASKPELTAADVHLVAAIGEQTVFDAVSAELWRSRDAGRTFEAAAKKERGPGGLPPVAMFPAIVGSMAGSSPRSSGEGSDSLATSLDGGDTFYDAHVAAWVPDPGMGRGAIESPRWSRRRSSPPPPGSSGQATVPIRRAEGDGEAQFAMVGCLLARGRVVGGATNALGRSGFSATSSARNALGCCVLRNRPFVAFCASRSGADAPGRIGVRSAEAVADSRVLTMSRWRWTLV